MEMRTLGRTGVKVSPYCLGAMMFGPWGNPDHDDCVRIIHAALDAGINFIDTADVYSAGESEEIVGKALAGDAATTSSSPPSSTAPMGDDPNMARQLASLDHQGGREQPAPARHRLHRPVPDPPARSPAPTSTRRSARSPISSTRARCATSARRRSRPRRSSRRSGRRSGATASASCASSRRTRSSPAASSAPCCRRARSTAWASSRGARSPAGGWPASTARARTCPTDCARVAAAACRRAFDPAIPENQRKLDLIEELVKVAADAGCRSPTWRIAFVLAHPAVTSAIIGPRTMEQLDRRARRAPTSCSTTTRSTRSTSSCRPGPTSRSATRGRRRGCASRPAAARHPAGGDQRRRATVSATSSRSATSLGALRRRGDAHGRGRIARAVHARRRVDRHRARRAARP